MKKSEYRNYVNEIIEVSNKYGVSTFAKTYEADEVKSASEDDELAVHLMFHARVPRILNEFKQKNIKDFKLSLGFGAILFLIATIYVKYTYCA